MNLVVAVNSYACSMIKVRVRLVGELAAYYFSGYHSLYCYDKKEILTLENAS